MSGKVSANRRFSLKSIVGMLVFISVAAYFIFMFFQYKNRSSVNFYEVEEGSLVKEHSYEGLIFRKESVKNAGASGYIYYFISDSRKAAMNSRIYCIDQSGSLKDYLASYEINQGKLSKEKISAVRNKLVNASRSFDPLNFRDSYALKEDLDASVMELSDTEDLAQISEQLKNVGAQFHEYRTDETGIVSYTIDGYEDLLKTDLKSDSFDRTSYEADRRKAGDLVEEGEPVFKLVTDETWQIVFPMTEEDIARFSGKTSLKVNFKEKGIETLADFSTFRSMDGNIYGELEMKRWLIQFVSDRFVDFEVETNDVSGLKIPEKSITEKNFYLIPVGMKKQDEHGNTGFYKEKMETGGSSYSFIVTEVYYEDEDYCYVNLPSSGSLSEGDFVADPEMSETRYQIGAVRPLKGVYNINKGYAVFKRIEELERANGYCIVAKNTNYGLSVYDHIILDASTVEEGQVLY